MKKVCIVRHGYYPADERVRKEALALIDKGYKVDMICLKDREEKKFENYEGVNIFRLPIQRKRTNITRYLLEYLSFFCLAFIKLNILHFRNRYDCVQVNTLPDFLVFVALIQKLCGARVILDLHEPAPELFETVFGVNNKLMIKLVTFFEQISIAYADRVITVSEQMKDNYVKRGSPSEKISVVLNVPNLEFNPDLYEAERGGRDDRFSLICHGAMLKRYGQHVAIRAIALIKEEIPNVRLNILGYGEYEDELKRLACELGLEDYVTFRGFIPFIDLIKTIAASDLGIVPVEKNRYSDLVHTNKMFEYISMKIPVVITRTRAVEQFFGPDYRSLKYFESGDAQELAKAVIELYRHPVRREKMAKSALAKYETVKWENSKEDYCRLFA